jgi:hypothetical protein
MAARKLREVKLDGINEIVSLRIEVRRLWIPDKWN